MIEMSSTYHSIFNTSQQWTGERHPRNPNLLPIPMAKSNDPKLSTHQSPDTDSLGIDFPRRTRDSMWVKLLKLRHENSCIMFEMTQYILYLTRLISYLKG